jgi:hypothetical protein
MKSDETENLRQNISYEKKKNISNIVNSGTTSFSFSSSLR